jgi:DNA-binding transcriptional MerR regulator
MKAKYSIKDLEYLSGIKAHTIRIWEQRHGIICPKRTETNIRFYEDDDLRKILNVSFLVHEGIKISKVADLSDQELCQMVQDKSTFKSQKFPETNDLKMAMYEFDTDKFDETFQACVLKYGEEATFTQVLGDFISQLGLLWQTKTVSVVHEHFVSSLIKQKLYSAIDRKENSFVPEGPVYLLYLPSNELHELGLLYLQYYLLRHNRKVINLGQNTPAEYLREVYDKVKFDILVSVSTTQPNAADAEIYLLNLKKSFEDTAVKIFMCGPQLIDQIEQFSGDKTLHLFRSLTEMKASIIV